MRRCIKSTNDKCLAAHSNMSHLKSSSLCGKTMDFGRSTGLGNRSQSASNLSEASSTLSLQLYSLDSSVMNAISEHLSASTRNIRQLPAVAPLRSSAESLRPTDAERMWNNARAANHPILVFHGYDFNQNFAIPFSASVISLPGNFLPEPVRLINENDHDSSNALERSVSPEPDAADSNDGDIRTTDQSPQCFSEQLEANRMTETESISTPEAPSE